MTNVLSFCMLQEMLCTESDAMEIVLQGMDPVSHAGLLLVGNMKSLYPSHSSSFGIANLSFLLKPAPSPYTGFSEASSRALWTDKAE